MITLYPTETVYALGVNALDPKAFDALRALKGRGEEKVASWLVENVEAIAKYAEVNEKAALLAQTYMPGPLTLVLSAKPHVPGVVLPPDRTIGFRVSSDLIAQKLAAEYGGPLTCTSANRSGQPTCDTPEEILKQFGTDCEQITRVIHDGVRNGTPSTVLRVLGEDVEILREGAISRGDIISLLHSLQ